MKPATQAYLQNVLDMATGADGGADYWSLRLLLDQLDIQADQGDKAAVELIQVVARFSRLIDVARTSGKAKSPEISKEPTTLKTYRVLSITTHELEYAAIVAHRNDAEVYVQRADGSWSRMGRDEYRHFLE